MSANTSIEWCNHTFNPWHGCAKVSPACRSCYAEALDRRWGHANWGVDAPRRFFGEAHWREPLKWFREAERARSYQRVFCASMADVFEHHSNQDVQATMAAARRRLFELVEQTAPWLQWLFLTKRPENQALMVPAHWSRRPPPNAWLGVTAENQEYVDARVPYLITAKWPAVRFVSYEPALGDVDFTHIDAERAGHPDLIVIDALRGRQTDMGRPCPDVPKIDWIIAGAESGAGSRSREPSWDWYRSVRDQCASAGVAFFLKQHAVKGRKISLPLLDGRQWAEFPEGVSRG